MNDTYMDNASTSHLKAPGILEAITSYLDDSGSSPGRAGHHLARKGDQLVNEARKKVASFLGASNSAKISYTYNATYALNLILKAKLQTGDHVITSCLDHNSTLRPLETLRREKEIEYTPVGLTSENTFDMDDYKKSFRKNTALVSITHASNVLGIINPVEQIIEYAHSKKIPVLIDASQTAGFLDIDIDKWNVDFIVFTGHKSLLGLPGIGGLYVRDERSLPTLIEGGTGGNSLSLRQPGLSPEKYEAGTINYTGIVGLGAAIDYLSSKALANIQEHEYTLTEMIVNQLKEMPEILLYTDYKKSTHVPTFSFNISGLISNEVSTILDEKFGIMTRPGIQCAPLAHAAIGTSPNGTVRVSIGLDNTEKDVDYFISAIKDTVRLRVK